MDETRNVDGYALELSDFRTHFTIHCPDCGSKSTLINRRRSGFIEGKITCTKSGFNKKLGEKNSYEISTNDGEVIESKLVLANPNPLRMVLWYSANFKGKTLWGYNDDHLKFLFEFIDAKHRSRSQTEFKNRSFGSRLPRWLSSASNRGGLSTLIQEMLK